MVKVRVTVEMVPEGGQGSKTWELEESRVMELLQWLFGAPNLPVQQRQTPPTVLPTEESEGNGKRIIDWIHRAYDTMTQRPVTAQQLASQMRALGWVTKSHLPHNVVGSTLREPKSGYVKAGNGWIRKGDPVPSTLPGRPANALRPPVGPGLRVLVTNCVRERGRASLEEITSSIFRAYGEKAAQFASIRGTVRRLVREGKMREVEPGVFAL